VVWWLFNQEDVGEMSDWIAKKRSEEYRGQDEIRRKYIIFHRKGPTSTTHGTRSLPLTGCCSDIIQVTICALLIGYQDSPNP